MTHRSSTIPSVDDPTIGDLSLDARRLSLQEVIVAEWSRFGRPDLMGAIERHPQILRDRSLLLELAIREFQVRSGREGEIELSEHCSRFAKFGSSIERSIFRQLETQAYIDAHPELIEYLSQAIWPSAGETFGNFFILEELGRGGTARVYLCRQSDVGNRPVVIKATPHISFEAAILGRLSHPNIVPVYSAGQIEERSLNFLCMPYLGRSTLADLIDLAYGEGMKDDVDLVTKVGNRWIPCEEQARDTRRASLLGRLSGKSFIDLVIDVGLKLARALAHAHTQNILHGDLKPSNVLVTPAGEPLLLDFNLSQDQAASTELRGGTLPYMPPEHLIWVAGQGDASKHFDPRSDIYSFGALMFELLTGKPPLTLPPKIDDVATIAGEFHRAMEAGHTSMDDFGSNIGTGLSSLIMQCLSFDIEARPASAGELIARLEREAHPLVRIRREVHSRPRLTVSAVVVALTLVIAGATYLVTRPPRHEELFEEGMRSLAAGQYPGAAAAFGAALEEDPSYTSARFQLGRSLIELGELDSAIVEFSSLAREANETESIAYVGYCFNLKGTPVAAIPWYERALNKGVESAAIYNNLGVSYFISTSQLSPSEKLARADALLQRALEIDGSSVVVRMNLIRLELVRKGARPSELTQDSSEQLQFILANSSDEDLAKWSDILALYSSHITESAAPNIMRLKNHNRLTAFTERFGKKEGNVDTSHIASHRPEQMAASRSLFIEPVLPTQPTAN